MSSHWRPSGFQVDMREVATNLAIVGDLRSQRLDVHLFRFMLSSRLRGGGLFDPDIECGGW